MDGDGELNDGFISMELQNGDAYGVWLGGDISLERWEDSFLGKLFSFKVQELVKRHSSVPIRSFLFPRSINSAVT